MSVARIWSPLRDGLAQIGACGIFLFRILRAIPLSLRYLRETVRQIFFVGAMSLVIIMDGPVRISCLHCTIATRYNDPRVNS